MTRLSRRQLLRLKDQEEEEGKEEEELERISWREVWLSVVEDQHREAGWRTGTRGQWWGARIT